jgi:hypothetical protein
MQKGKFDGKQQWHNFWAHMLNWLEKDNSLLGKIVLHDEATFCLSSKINPNFILRNHVVFFNMCMTAQNAYISYYQLNRGL